VTFRAAPDDWVCLSPACAVDRLTHYFEAVAPQGADYVRLSIAGAAICGYYFLLEAPMHSKGEKLLHRDRCFELAASAPTEAIRGKLLRIAHLYEIEASLIDRARQCITDSKELIIKVETLLRPAGWSPPARAPKSPPRAPSRAIVAPVPSIIAEASHQ
jgi:hypothetical protein